MKYWLLYDFIKVCNFYYGIVGGILLLFFKGLGVLGRVRFKVIVREFFGESSGRGMRKKNYFFIFLYVCMFREFLYYEYICIKYFNKCVYIFKFFYFIGEIFNLL